MALRHFIILSVVLTPLAFFSSDDSCRFETKEQGSALLQRKHSVSERRDIAAKSASHKSGHCEECDGKVGYKRFKGEFHEPLAYTGDIMQLLESPKCKNFYTTAGDWHPSRTIVDHYSRLFRPAAEVELLAEVPEAEPSLPITPFQRMITYEDMAFPMDFYSDNVTGTTGNASAYAKEGWCEMFAIRTPQRPVKVVSWNRTALNKTFVIPAIWKVGSTSISKMLVESSKQGVATGVRGCHSSNTGFAPENPLLQNERHTSFHEDAANAEVKAALVRSPLDRFLASIYEHGAWRTCTVNATAGQACEEQVAVAKAMARRLASEFPHSYRSCSHPSQVYFLSATDVYGKPYVWNQVMRLEDSENSWGELRNMTGAAELSENPSGDKDIKSMYFKAVFSDLETVCSVCKVYAQDFECLGYVKPEQCTPDECKKVGVDILDPYA